MKTYYLLIAFLLGTIFYSFKSGETISPLKIGAALPHAEIKMKDISGQQVSLTDIKEENGLLVIFSCNTCPFVIQWEDRYPQLGSLCKKNNIGMVLINSNQAKREDADSFSNMISHAKEANYNCYYTLDKNSQIANAFGAKTTPHVFLFNEKMELVYEGAIDDNSKDASLVKANYLNDAITNLTDGKPIDPNNTKAVGCSIKRVKK